MEKSRDAFRTISEVAEWLGTPTHVLRFWESRFSQVKPVKRAGGRRYYRPGDMQLLGGIKKLLHDDGMTIRGVQKLLREEGARHVAALSPSVSGPDADAIIEAIVIPSTDEAPIELDVVQAPPENVVQFDEAQQGSEDQQEPASAPTPEEPATPPPETPVAAKPITAEVPDDPEDDEPAQTPDIVNVALSLRKFADAQSLDKSNSGVFSTIYDRLTRLRARMDDPSSSDSSD